MTLRASLGSMRTVKCPGVWPGALFEAGPGDDSGTAVDRFRLGLVDEW